MKSIIAISLGFLGCLLIVCKNISHEFSSSGEYYIVLAAACYAMLGVYVKKYLTKYDPPAVSTIMFIFGSLFLFIYGLIFESFHLPKSEKVIYSLVWMAVIGSALAQVLVQYLIRMWSPTQVSMITYCIPCVAIILGVCFLHEKLQIYDVIGFLVILISVVIMNSKKRI